MVPRTSMAATASEYFIRNYPKQAAQYVEKKSFSEIRSILAELASDVGARLIREMGPETSVTLLEDLEANELSKILTSIPVEDLAFLINRASSTRKQRLIGSLPETLKKDIEELTSFSPNTAGYYMDPLVIVVHRDQTVETALTKIRKRKDERINDIFVIDDDRHLVGKVRIQLIAIAEPDQRMGDLVTAPPLSINGISPKEDVVEMMEKYKLLTIPVVDGQERIIGAIRHDALMEVIQEEALSDLQSMVGVSREEKALSKASFAIKKRLPWLGINLLTAFLASFVVGMFEGILAKVTALAVLLPVVAGQSGNTGAQALAVTVRGIALREIRPRHGWQVLRKEGLVGFVNGIAIGLACALAVYVWSQSIGLSLVIGISMVLAMFMASLAGAAIPVILTLLGQDPAQSSSIILTTVTDVAGFLSFLGLATLMYSLLV